MKLICQIALGVFLGVVAAQLCVDYWRDNREQQKLVEREKARLEQADLIRKQFIENQQSVGHDDTGSPPNGFVPDDAPSTTTEPILPTSPP